MRILRDGLDRAANEVRDDMKIASAPSSPATHKQGTSSRNGRSMDARSAAFGPI